MMRCSSGDHLQAYAPYCAANYHEGRREKTAARRSTACFEAEQMLVKIDTAARFWRWTATGTRRMRRLPSVRCGRCRPITMRRICNIRRCTRYPEGEHAKLLSREFETWQVEIKSY